MNIVIYPGSFNPVHLGHIAVAKSALANRWTDEVWMLVSPHNPLKNFSKLLPEEHRFAMLKLGINGIDSIVASDFEFSLAKPTYTYQTLRQLKNTYPNHNFKLLVGGDNLELFSKWRNSKDILTEFGLIVYPRPGSKVEINASMCGYIQMLSGELLEVSSTEIRSKLESGDSLEGLVSTDVEKYLKQM